MRKKEEEESLKQEIEKIKKQLKNLASREVEGIVKDVQLLQDNTNELFQLLKDEEQRCEAFRYTFEIFKSMWDDVIIFNMDADNRVMNLTKEYLYEASTKGGQKMSSDVEKFKNELDRNFKMYKIGKIQGFQTSIGIFGNEIMELSSVLANRRGDAERVLQSLEENMEKLLHEADAFFEFCKDDHLAYGLTLNYIKTMWMTLNCMNLNERPNTFSCDKLCEQTDGFLRTVSQRAAENTEEMSSAVNEIEEIIPLFRPSKDNK